MSFDAEALTGFVSGQVYTDTTEAEDEKSTDTTPDAEDATEEVTTTSSESSGQPPGAKSGTPLGQSIFIAHGKNKKPVEHLKKILDQFHIPYKVAVDEPNLGRPISGKVREIMHACNCAILVFTADAEFQDPDGNTIWRPSENVVYELGAAGYLYDRRIVILKDDKVTFPSNFSDLGYISFEEGQLEAKTMDVLKELIGFGIVRIST